jgi:mRNA interferase MazF
MKDFNNWNKLKIEIEKSNFEDNIYYSEREIWWCHLGENLGIESCGKGNKFNRPVLIIRKYNKHHCIVVPTTTKVKFGKFYFPIIINNQNSFLMLTQIKTIDSKRLENKIGTVELIEFNKIKNLISEIF